MLLEQPWLMNETICTWRGASAEGLVASRTMWLISTWETCSGKDKSPVMTNPKLKLTNQYNETKEPVHQPVWCIPPRPAWDSRASGLCRWCPCDGGSQRLQSHSPHKTWLCAHRNFPWAQTGPHQHEIGQYGAWHSRYPAPYYVIPGRHAGSVAANTRTSTRGGRIMHACFTMSFKQQLSGHIMQHL